MIIETTARKTRARRGARAHALALLAALLATATLPAQIDRLFDDRFGGRDDERDRRQEFQQPSILGPDAAQLLRDDLPRGFAPPEGGVPLFQGFPSLVPPDFSAYPGGKLVSPFASESPEGGVALAPPPALPRSPNAWPSWFEGPETADVEGFTADVGILAQATDLVWLRPARGGAFVPLTFHDRYRVVAEGSMIEVRGDGVFMLVFQGGATARVSGSTRLSITQLDDAAVELDLSRSGRLRLTAGDRPFRLRLRDAGELEATGTSVVMARDGGLLRVQNRGPGELTAEVAGGEVPVPAGHRIWLMPDAPPPDERASAALAVRGGVTTSRDGRRLSAESPVEGGVVEWSGARFALPPGGRLRIDPLAGADFPDHRNDTR